MPRPEPFPVGSSIVWRSRPDGDVGYVFGCRVLLDEVEVAAVVQPTGSPIVRRVAQRGGPNGRSVLPGTWDGSRHQSSWDRPPGVRLHPVGRGYSVIRTWLAGERRFEGWYVNLERSWIRTPLGFDSCDDVLDIVVTEDLTGWQLKDVDELEFAVEAGQFTSGDAQRIHEAAQSALDDIAARRWPFDAVAWSEPLPDRLLEPTALPDGWDTP